MDGKLCTKCGVLPRRASKNATYCVECFNAQRRVARAKQREAKGLPPRGTAPMCALCGEVPCERKNAPARGFYACCKSCIAVVGKKATRNIGELTHKQRIHLIALAHARAIRRAAGRVNSL